MGVYTKTGDKGETGLLGGSRIAKDSLKVSCYGTLDEANAVLGSAFSLVKDQELRAIIHHIQKKLFVVGAELASDENGKDMLQNKVCLTDIEGLEKTIDSIENKLGPIHEFIIPGQTTASALLHQARSIIRRAERLIVKLSQETDVRVELLKYVNRLSDTIFMLARAEVQSSFIHDVKEKVIAKLQPVTDHDFILDLSLAKRLAEVAEKKALEIQVPIVFSVVDKGGHPILLHRMEGSLLGSIDISLNKAFTSVAFKMSTDQVSEVTQPGKELYGLQLTNQQKVVPFGGGYPLLKEGTVLGGIGVSGGSVEEDMIIAQAALAVLQEK